MLTPGTSDSGTLVHAVGFHSSDDTFVQRFAPFCEDGLRSDHPTVVRVDKRKADLLRMALDDPDDLLFLDPSDEYGHPVGALRSVLQLHQQHAAGTNRPLRVLGELPPLQGLARDVWMRYEAAFNHHVGPLSVHALCVCDERRVTGDLRRHVLRNHHAVVDEDGTHRPNTSFVPPEAFGGGDSGEPACDPLEQEPPAAHLTDPTPKEARHAAERLARRAGLGTLPTDSLLHGVTEVVTNAVLHGRPPVELWAWTAGGRVVVAVRDAGDGPRDPFAGLLPKEQLEKESGRGLSITHQLCPETTLSRSREGFTVRMAVGSARD